ncbi:hypothetical protein [Paenibacillus terrigena]|uniref:hypothetical protein n=1 Tax=Paenibacillus terrigena TaxID=369333 RepID=UPI000594AEDD|nr:hypothetical protein [Paenibacillus terrigena]
MYDAWSEFKTISKHRMVHHYLPKLEISLRALNQDMIWQKELQLMNSIGGIVLHITEHVMRNTTRLLQPDAVFTKGIENSFPDLNMTQDQLIHHLTEVFTAFEKAINTVDINDMYSIYHLVEHTGYHLGQIVDRAQRMTGVQFQFVQNGIHESALKQGIEREYNDKEAE